MNKYASFAKNAMIGATAGMLVGAGAAELSDILFDNNTATACISTAVNLATAYSVFLPLHYRSNRDVYEDEKGNPKWREYIRDQVKLVGALSLVDAMYVASDPVITRQFLESGTQPAESFLYTQIILGIVAMAVTVPLAKLTGNIRDGDDCNA